MKNFNAVFLVVKKYCGESGITGDVACFEAIARELDIPVTAVDFYLNALQDLGLVRYSLHEGYIKITPFGQRQEKLFI